MRILGKLGQCLALAGVVAACNGSDRSNADGSAGAAAHGGGAGSAGSKVSAEVEYLTPSEHLVRASMALRGIRPSLEELAAVRKDPKYVAAIVDYYLDSPEFGVTMRELHAEALLVGVDPVIYPAGFPSIGKLSGMTAQQLNSSIVQAPLRLIEHVITSDRPYSEIVTADYTLADSTVATVWGLPYDAKGELWQETKYADGRPTAGILSDSFLFTRHGTTYSNKSRGRANLVSRALLCYDFLSREIPIDTGIDLADEGAVTHAVQENPACLTCHQTLDPLAAYFAPFRPIYVPSDLKAYPYDTYVESLQKPFSVTEPGFFGAPSKNLKELGAAIAKDPRFSLCAAKRFYSYLAEVNVEDVPHDLAARLQSVLLDHDLSAKALARAIVLSDEFRSAYGKTEDAAEDLVGLMKTRPEALARTVQDLTGYRWETTLPFPIQGAVVGEVDLMSDAFFGFKVLAGGVDGQSVTRPSHTMSATTTLTFEALASHASEHVVVNDFANPKKEARRLLKLIDEKDTSEANVRAQLAALELRFYGTDLASDAPEVDDAYELFTKTLAAHSGNALRAWTMVVYALLQDPRMAYY